MPRVTTSQLAQRIDELCAHMAQLSERLARLETQHAPAAPVPAPPTAARAAAAPQTPSISEEQLVAISAAIGAYLGIRVHVRQVRLVSSPAWAQQGRVSIQASHKLAS